MRIGVIGTGNIGSMIATAFALSPELEVFIFNRSREKAEQVLRRSPRVRISETAAELVHTANVVFLCTKAKDGLTLMETLGHQMTEKHILVTTISTVSAGTWESMTPARVAKVIPSIVQTTLSGVILVHYGSRFDGSAKNDFEQLLQRIAMPYEVGEPQMRVASDLTSCGPALMAYLLLEWARMAAATGRISLHDAEKLLTQTTIGLADVLQSGMSLGGVIRKVAVPGGVTEVGVRSLSQRAPNMFKALHEATEDYAQGSPTASLNQE